MKLLYTCLLFCFFLIGNTLAGLEIEQLPLVTNAKNDMGFVFTDVIGNDDIYSTYYDISTNKSYPLSLEEYSISELNNVYVNSNSQTVAYFINDKIIFFDYTTQSRFSEISLADIKNHRVVFEFSENGKEFYILDMSESQFLAYNIESTQITHSFTLSEDILTKQFAIFNIPNGTFAVKIDGGLDIWSIEKEEKLRTIPLSNGIRNIGLQNGGYQISYTIDNEVFVANYFDGNLIFAKKFGEHYIDKLIFSADGRYLVAHNNSEQSFIFDTQNNEIVDLDLEDDIFSSYTKCYLITNNLEKALMQTSDGLYCPDYKIEMSIEYKKHFFVNVKEEKILSSIPTGLVEATQHPIVSDDGRYVLATTEYIKNNKQQVLFSIDKDYIRYIYVDENPLLFVNDANDILFTDSLTIRTYNIENDEFDRQLDPEMGVIDDFHYSTSDGGKLILSNSDTINVFNFADFSLERSIDIGGINLKHGTFRFDGKETLVKYAYKKIYKINILSGSIEFIDLSDRNLSVLLYDYTSDGNFLLFYDTSNYIATRYEISTNEFKEVDLRVGNLLGEHSDFKGIGFLGNNQTIWYSFVPNPIDRYTTTYYYNFAKDSLYGGSLGFLNPHFSENNEYYTSLSYCGDGFGIRKVNELISSVKVHSYNKDLDVYPNPTNDYITLSIESEQNVNSYASTSVFIYDTMGKVCKTVNVFDSAEKLDVHDLRPGVYHIIYGDFTAHFVKY